MSSFLSSSSSSMFVFLNCNGGRVTAATTAKVRASTVKENLNAIVEDDSLLPTPDFE